MAAVEAEPSAGSMGISGDGLASSRGGAAASGDWPRTIGPPWQPSETSIEPINSQAAP